MTKRWVVVLVCFLGCEKAARQPTPALLVEILGSRTAFDHYRIDVAPLNGPAALELRSPFLVQRFWSTDSISIVKEMSLDITSTDAEFEICKLELRPFVCGLTPNFSQRVATGWQAKETLQVYLDDFGKLTQYSDFGRILSDKCEWTSPDGNSGEGSSSLSPSPTFCSEPERRNTVLTFTDNSVSDRVITFSPTYCQALHLRSTVPDPDFEGMIINQFNATMPDGTEVILALSHCWTSAETYPLDAFPISTGNAACGETKLLIGPVETRYSIPAVEGRWTLANGPYLKGGETHRSEINLMFSDPNSGGKSFAVSGHVALPIVKSEVIRLR